MATAGFFLKKNKIFAAYFYFIENDTSSRALKEHHTILSKVFNESV